VNVEELIAKSCSMNPMGRNARPQELAASASFLVADKGSYVYVAAIAVEVGMTA
jgi:hypothetical protein